MLRAQSETSNAQQTQHGCSRIRWCAGLWLKNSNLVWHSFQCLHLPVFPNMPSSSVLLAKRSLVSLLLRLAVAYQVVIFVNRTSPDAGVKAAFRKVVLKVHPDKGGDTAEFQKLQEAKEQWEAAAKSANCSGSAQTLTRSAQVPHEVRTRSGQGPHKVCVGCLRL